MSYGSFLSPLIPVLEVALFLFIPLCLISFLLVTPIVYMVQACSFFFPASGLPLGESSYGVSWFTEVPLLDFFCAFLIVLAAPASDQCLFD